MHISTKMLYKGRLGVSIAMKHHGHIDQDAIQATVRYRLNEKTPCTYRRQKTMHIPANMLYKRWCFDTIEIDYHCWDI